ncbi:MAG: hypothetical protein HRU25_08220 [Psychrobium sp.]|nr:hypothetical protein [Psychrobium sp.]
MVDTSFYNIVFPILALMPLCAVGIICCILKYAQLCPGQHSRIQGELITIWTIMFVAIMMGAESTIATWILVVGGVGAGYGILLSIWQGKLPNKRAIPDKAIYFSLLPISVFSVGVLWSQSTVFIVLPMLTAGCALAHLLLVKAKHRLQVFNKILPVTGVIASIVSLLWLSLLIANGQEAMLTSDIVNNLFWCIGFLVLALALWLLPLFSTNPQSYTLLGVATFLLLLSQVLIYEIILIYQSV